jgi:SAM-dependent methyltransferase
MEIGRILPLLKEGSREKNGRVFFIEPPPDIRPESMTEDEMTNQKNWTGWRARNYEYLEKQLRLLGAASIIADLGAGQISYKKLIAGFPNYFGVDFYPYDEVKVVCDFTEKLPIKDSAVDAVILSNVLEHVPTPELLIREAFRILKPGGTIIGAVPFIIKIHQEPHDFLRYTNYMLEALFKNAGFTKIELSALGSTANIYRFAEKFFFGQLVSETNGIKKIAAHLARLLARGLNMLFWPLYKTIGPAEKYPEGYGFTVYKPR